mgnify:CR=1 FL=1
MARRLYDGEVTDLLALTATLVDHQSVSFEEAAFVDWLEAELRSCDHLVVDRVGDNLVARTELGREQRLLLVGHTDTVPVVDADDLIGGTNGVARIEGDTLWGVGSTDMKGGLACFFEIAMTVTEPTAVEMAELTTQSTSRPGVPLALAVAGMMLVLAGGFVVRRRRTQ